MCQDCSSKTGSSGLVGGSSLRRGGSGGISSRPEGVVNIGVGGASGSTYDPRTDSMKVPGLPKDFGKTIGESVKERSKFDVLSNELGIALMSLDKQISQLHDDLAPVLGSPKADSYSARGDDGRDKDIECKALEILEGTINNVRTYSERIQYIRDRLVI